MEVKEVFAETVIKALSSLETFDTKMARKVILKMEVAAQRLDPNKVKFVAEALRTIQKWLAMSDAELAFQFISATNSSVC